MERSAKSAKVVTPGAEVSALAMTYGVTDAIDE
jgi:hypothetical protein